MSHEETRERLNSKKIATHYLEQLLNPFHIVLIALLYLLSFIIVQLFINQEEVHTTNFAIFIYCLLAIDLIITLGIAWLIWDYLQLRKGNFQVIVAPVVHMIEATPHRYSGPLFHFSKHGWFFLGTMPLYQSSPYYKTTVRELFDRTCQGDTFYLIKRHKWAVLMIYPTRCFVWNGEIQNQ